MKAIHCYDDLDMGLLLQKAEDFEEERAFSYPEVEIKVSNPGRPFCRING